MKTVPYKPQKADIDPRYMQFVMQNTIRDVFDALVELITNCDDSYHRLFLSGKKNTDGGNIFVEIERRSKDSSKIIVKDRAEGMTLDEMKKKIRRVGAKTSGKFARGFMGRGAKDCAALGDLEFESIKGGKYFKCEFSSDLKFIPHKTPKLDNSIREKLGILRGNGTVVTLTIAPQHRIPQFNTVLRDLPYHFSLKDILAEDSTTKVNLIDLNLNRKERLVYYQPEGELKIAEVFEIPEYQGRKAKFKVWRLKESVESSGDRFPRNGIIIKGKRAIHECSFLIDEFIKDPFANKYIGRIECEYIDELCDEYDYCRERGKNPPQSNPFLIIDPNRQKGLRGDHPFTKALFKIPCDHLRNLIQEDKQKERERRVEVANKATKDRLQKLAKVAGKYLKQQIEELEEISSGEVEKGMFEKEGIVIFPTWPTIKVGEHKKLAVYVKEDLLEEKKNISIICDDDSLEIINPLIQLKAHKNRKGLYMEYFEIEGIKPKDSVLIEAILSEKKTGEAIAHVTENIIEDHLFINAMEFEHNNYKVGEGKQRSIRLFATYPDIMKLPAASGRGIW